MSPRRPRERGRREKRRFAFEVSAICASAAAVASGAIGGKVNFRRVKCSRLVICGGGEEEEEEEEKAGLN